MKKSKTLSAKKLAGFKKELVSIAKKKSEGCIIFVGKKVGKKSTEFDTRILSNNITHLDIDRIISIIIGANHPEMGAMVDALFGGITQKKKRK